MNSASGTLLSSILLHIFTCILSYNPYNNYRGSYNAFPYIGHSVEPVAQVTQAPQFNSFFGFPNFRDEFPFGQFPTNIGGNSISPEMQDTNPNRCGIQVQGCQKSRYRSFDGTCNNLKYPGWGTPNTTYTRLIAPKYGDGISTPTDEGQNFPLPRVLSLKLFPDVKVEDPIWTLATMQFGQIVTHDMSMIAGSTQAKAHKTQCCMNGRRLDKSVANYHCYPLEIPIDDPVLKQTNMQCSNFVRTITDRDRNCVAGRKPAEQLTVVTAYLDASFVYGSALEQNIPLRAFQGGRLITEDRYGRQFPPTAMNRTAACDIQAEDEVCYMAGDQRVNQNPQLTVFQVLYLREHNRLADGLAHINPHWNDETLFQEARRILIAEHQHITYYEWLPILIGRENSLEHGVIYNSHDYVNDYREDVNPGIINSHATAAFRYFHSAIAGQLELTPPSRHAVGALRLSDWFNRPGIIEEGNNFDDLTRGMTTQRELNNDVFFDSEITQFLFRRNNQFGMDLRAIDIQRNRDHGLASYNDYRELCHLPRAFSFEDFQDVIPHEFVAKLASLYKNPDDVDLTVGGALENRVQGTLVGPTFLCILTEQFHRTRVGDRFFFENGNKDTAFTLPQLNEIRKASISKFICNNADRITEMQPDGFRVISKTNPIVPCDHLPDVDLSAWKDLAVQKEAYYDYYKK